MRLIRICIGMVFVFLLAGCTSVTGFSGLADFTGCICSTDGKAVKGYVVCLDGKQTVTGEGGVFVFSDVGAGMKKLTGGKRGWCSFEQDIEFCDRKSVCYVQVQKMDKLYDQVEDFLRSGKTDEAQKLLESEKKFNDGEKVYEFYRNLVAYKKGNKAAGDKLKEFL